MAKQIFTLIACLALAQLGSALEWYPKIPKNIPENRICRPSENGYYIYDPNDCQKYFICGSDGKAHEQTCYPQSYHIINDKLGECRPLQEVNCGTRRLHDELREPNLILPELQTTVQNEDQSKNEDGITNEELNSKNGDDIAIGDSKDNVDETWREQSNCLGQKDGKYNIPNQCRKFLTCQDGKAFVTSCPANLIFDELINQPGQEGCEWLENAKRTDCSQGVQAEAKEGKTDIEAVEGYSSIQPWMNQLDCSWRQDGKHSIPNHCGVYYYCLGGKNLGTQQCAVGTAFEKKQGSEGDCLYGEDISRNDCAEKQYCKEKGAGNHYTRDRACDRFMYCSSENGMALGTNCPVNTIFEFINEHQGYGCVGKEVTQRAECN